MQAGQEDTEREIICLWKGSVFTLDLEGQSLAVHAQVLFTRSNKPLATNIVLKLVGVGQYQ